MSQPVVTNEEASAEINATIVKMAQQARAQVGQSGHCQGYGQAAQCFAHAKALLDGSKKVTSTKSG